MRTQKREVEGTHSKIHFCPACFLVYVSLKREVCVVLLQAKKQCYNYDYN